MSRGACALHHGAWWCRARVCRSLLGRCSDRLAARIGIACLGQLVEEEAEQSMEARPGLFPDGRHLFVSRDRWLFWDRQVGHDGDGQDA